MADKKAEQDQSVSGEVLKQSIQSYERDVPLVETICACPDCPYCGNTPFMWHPNRRYCTQEALLEARRQERAQKAREEGREPGKVGRPLKDLHDDFFACDLQRNYEIKQDDPD